MNGSERRPPVSRARLEGARGAVERSLMRTLEEKGPGSFVSTHEVLGVIAEEYKELLDAVHGAGLTPELREEAVRSELLDIAVAVQFAIACMDSGTLDW